MKELAEKYIESAAVDAFGQRGVALIRGVNRLARLQGGASTAENYQLLGKRAAIAAGAGIAAVNVGATIVGSIISRRNLKRRIEKAVAEALAQEREHMRESEGEGGREAASRAAGFYQRFGKRACDIAISIAALPIVGAVSAVSGVAIKREDGGPVFYNAPRVGLNGREFTMYKLRSMRVNAPDLVMEDGSTYNSADDPRMTRVGTFLRRTSLDELPQFINVLKGDMSVVGPRPDLAREAALYKGDEALKLTVKPGVTGYAAVYGRNSLPWHDRLALDVHYVRNASFALDAKVFFKTFTAVFTQEGIYNASDA